MPDCTCLQLCDECTRKCRQHLPFPGSSTEEEEKTCLKRENAVSIRAGRMSGPTPAPHRFQSNRFRFSISIPRNDRYPNNDGDSRPVLVSRDFTEVCRSSFRRDFIVHALSRTRRRSRSDSGKPQCGQTSLQRYFSYLTSFVLNLDGRKYRGIVSRTLRDK